MILFVCIPLPLLLTLFLLEKRSRITVLYLIIGTFIAVFAASVNGFLHDWLMMSEREFTITVSPIVEEVLKSFPILFHAVVVSDKKENLLMISIALGIGFGIFENAYLMVSNVYGLTIVWAFIRAFGTALMHGICTCFVGLGISYINRRRKFFYTGIFAILTLSIIYHATYNSLVQSSLEFFGFFMPIVTYSVVLLTIYRDKIKSVTEKQKNLRFPNKNLFLK